MRGFHSVCIVDCGRWRVDFLCGLDVRR